MDLDHQCLEGPDLDGPEVKGDPAVTPLTHDLVAVPWSLETPICSHQPLKLVSGVSHVLRVPVLPLDEQRPALTRWGYLVDMVLLLPLV